MSNQEAIGLIDSGVGGLTVLKALKQLPNERLIYLGDTARCPYGHDQPTSRSVYLGNGRFLLKNE